MNYFSVMVLASINLILAIAALWKISTVRNCKGILWLAGLLGLHITHSAHYIMFEVEGTPGDHQRTVDVLYMLVYLPLTMVFVTTGFGKGDSHKYWKVLLGATFLVAGYLYGLISFRPSIRMYSYAHAAWSTGMIAMIFLLQCVLKTSMLYRSTKVEVAQVQVLLLWFFVLSMPFLVDAAVSLLPSDNFVLPYRPALTATEMKYLLSAIVLSLLLWKVHQFVTITKADSIYRSSGSNERELAW